MAEKPIIFSAPMVRAILAGYKTQTRRVVAVGPGGEVSRGGRFILLRENGFEWTPAGSKIEPCPDQIWVRYAAYQPGESLERVRREAQIEALEKLPCEYANEQGGETCLDSIESDELVFCPRCRALAELRKGGEK